MLSFAAILPGLGFLVVFFAAKLVFKLGKALVAAARNSLEFAKSLAPIADALAKTATKLGIHVEQLQQYQFAAQLSGVKTEQLNVGLQRFLRRTAEARQGTGVLRKEFDRLGIALVDQFGNVREGTDVFEDYLGAISKTKDKQEQLRLAFAAFDTEGVALVNLAKQGAEEFAKQRTEAERLGLVLSVGLLSSYEQINDQMTINVKRVEAARLKNSLFLAEMAVKWDTFKTNIKIAGLELLAVFRTFDTLTVGGLTQKLDLTEKAIEGTNKALNSSIANLPLVTGTLEVFLGGLIEDQERILEAIQLAKGEETQVAAGRPDQITEQIEQQIAVQERRLEQQQRLVEAAREGEAARERVANQIAAENAVLQLGIQATDAEREALTLSTVATLEAEQALQMLVATNREALAGEELRVDALGRIVGVAQESNQALLTTVKTLLITGDATSKMNRDFDRLESSLAKNVVALEKIEDALKGGAGETEKSKKKYRELGKEANRLKKEIDKARTGLVKMKQKLEDQSEAAILAGLNVRNLGNDYLNANSDLNRFNEGLERSKSSLEGTARAANKASDSIAGIGRETQNLGSVVAGDATDPSNIQRSINQLNAQLRQVSLAGSGAANRIQERFIRAELDRLEGDLRIANEQTRKGIIEGILRANEELSGDALLEEIGEALSLRQRLGLLPTSGSNKPGFKSVSTRRF